MLLCPAFILSHGSISNPLSLGLFLALSLLIPISPNHHRHCRIIVFKDLFSFLLYFPASSFSDENVVALLLFC